MEAYPWFNMYGYISTELCHPIIGKYIFNDEAFIITNYLQFAIIYISTTQIIFKCMDLWIANTYCDLQLGGALIPFQCDSMYSKEQNNLLEKPEPEH